MWYTKPKTYFSFLVIYNNDLDVFLSLSNLAGWESDLTTKKEEREQNTYVSLLETKLLGI